MPKPTQKTNAAFRQWMAAVMRLDTAQADLDKASAELSAARILFLCHHGYPAAC